MKGALLIDLSKAFDSLNHQILLSKLYHYGIRGPVNEYIKSFLQNRSLYCSFQNYNSNKVIVNSGVPQGCLLSPLLYNTYINDLSRFIKYFCVLYADDSTLVLDAATESELIQKMENCYINLNKYFKDLKLCLNEQKTQFIVFRKQFNKQLHLNTHTEVTSITASKEIKLLGILFDYNLSVNPHIAHKNLKRYITHC